MRLLKLFLLLPLTTPLYGGGVVIDVDATLFIQLFLFILFAFVMQRLIINPVMDILDKRSCATDGAVQEGKKLMEQALEKRALYEEQITEAKRQAQQKQDQMLQEAGEENRKTLEAHQQREQESWSRFQKDLAEQQKQLVGAILKDTESLSMIGISKIVE